MNKTYIGNMPFSVTDTQLNERFAKYGTVTWENITIDKFTGLPRGYAFVEMVTDEAARKAIAELNGAQIESRTLVVEQAKPQEESRERSFGEHSDQLCLERTRITGNKDRVVILWPGVLDNLEAGKIC